MAKLATIPDDIVEKILVRSNVEDLIRYKSVCKSWQSFISSSRFVKRHLYHSYNKHRNNTKHGHRSVFLDWLQQIGGCLILGSSNGLVCFYTFYDEILVANPCTREIRKVSKPAVPKILLSHSGFGYDQLTGDYKVIIVDETRKTSCHVLSLKSNVWKVIEQVKYTFKSRTGVLCNGALHWFMDDENKNKVIVSFDLSLEEFREIPQPNDSCYQWRVYYKLRIMEDCLSMHDCGLLPGKIWKMNKYNVRESWRILPQNCKIMREISFFINETKNNGWSMLQQKWYSKTHKYFCVSILIPSFVSPHIQDEQ